MGDVRRGVGDEDDRAPGVGEPAQGEHHPLLEPGVEAAGGLVEEEERGVGEQLGRDAHPLALPAGELVDALVPVAAMSTSSRTRAMRASISPPPVSAGRRSRAV